MSNFLPKKSLGQHWLNDEASLDAMLEVADVGFNDTILEVGPGPGSLTKKLVKTANKVIAVEKDELLASKLINNLSAKNLEVKTGDILRFDFTGLPSGYKLVANIPYYLTNNLVRILSEAINPPSVAALLLQKEVAQRLAAEPGQMSILSVTAQFYWQVSLGRVVKAELFEPPPKIDSQIAKLTRHQQPLFEVDEQQFFALVKAGFSQKRKTLTNCLSASFHISKSDATSWLTAADISPAARAQTLSLDEWYKLFLAKKSFD